MRGEIPQSCGRGGLSRHEAPLPEDLSGFTTGHLSDCFEPEFKTALKPLAHQIFCFVVIGRCLLVMGLCS